MELTSFIQTQVAIKLTVLAEAAEEQNAEIITRYQHDLILATQNIGKTEAVDKLACMPDSRFGANRGGLMKQKGTESLPLICFCAILPDRWNIR